MACSSKIGGMAMGRGMMMAASLALLLSAGAPAQAREAGPTPDGSWIVLDAMPVEVLQAEPWIRAKKFLPLALERDAMAAILAKAPLEGTPAGPEGGIEVTIPTPDGRIARFRAVESPVMEPELQARFPDVRTYWARGIDDPHAIARFDLTPTGFRAQVIAPEDGWTGGTYYIDPFSKGDDIFHSAYFRSDYAPEREPFRCFTLDQANDLSRDRFGDPQTGTDQVGTDQDGDPLARSGVTRRTYRLAVTTTGEYGTFHGGTVAQAQAAVVSLVNRVTGIYELDTNVRLTLVANNDQIVYVNAATDPYSSPGANTTTLNAMQTTIDTRIGSANYDVGHLVHQGGNTGVAGAIGNVCAAGQKGRGISVTNPPTGDLLAVDYVAHELGHQFAGRHSFNNCQGGQGDSGAFAVEPGSATTIMGYAGICGTTNIQSNSDPDFHAQTIDQIIAYVSSGTGSSCAVATPTGNDPPVVNAGPDVTIPRNTPFVLTAIASDPNNDPLTYDWDQIDGSATVNPIPLSGNEATGPLFRSRPASVSPSRTFPRLSDLVNNVNPVGERLPNVARTMNFKVNVRDGRGGVWDDTIAVAVSGTAGPFRVTAPTTNVSWSGVRTVTWDVAGTTATPISVANVRILLSTDGGLTYPTVLAANTPNDGSENVTIPATPSTTARIRVEAIGNVFFDISDTNFTIPATTPILVGTGANVVFDAVGRGNGNGNSRVDPGENAVDLTIPVRNDGGAGTSGVVGTLVSLTPTAAVVLGNANYGSVGLGEVRTNDVPYTIALSPSHPCGDPINLRLTLTGSGGPWTYNFSIPAGQPGGLAAAQTFSYSGPAVAINDNATASATVNVSGFTGNIADVDFRVGGTSCTTASGATTVGISHTYTGDLTLALRSPAGTTVTLMANVGGTGNNICNTLFDDDGSFPLIQSAVASNAPYNGTYRPNSPLSAFDGQAANGTWTFTVADNAGGDTGAIRAFSIILRGTTAPVCEPPATPVCPCNADYNNSGSPIADLDDILAFFEDFTAGLPAADVNCTGEGSVPDIDDVLRFFEVFGGGC